MFFNGFCCWIFFSMQFLWFLFVVETNVLYYENSRNKKKTQIPFVSTFKSLNEEFRRGYNNVERIVFSWCTSVRLFTIKVKQGGMF